MDKPNVLFLMCDQFRFDCIASLGNHGISTPNLDRLVRRGVSFDNAYSTCPVCVPARYTVRTGCEPYTTLCYCNEYLQTSRRLDTTMTGRCGEYLASAMRAQGYYAFGIGKFHTVDPYEDCGYDLQLHTEEMWGTHEDRMKDAYAAFICNEHPEYRHIQQLHGERTNMYYMPQTSPFPPELTVEGFVASKAVEQIGTVRSKPYFGFVSFVGPHPPCAPPVPYNIMYNPDRMPDPVCGDPEVDLMDEQIRWMNHAIWADEMNNFLARNVKSRYYGEISYIDACIGQILDAVEARDDADNTLICFFSDHGDHLGDHHAWQKESYFEQSCHVPFLLSWPKRYKGSQHSDALVTLADLFGIATQAAGNRQLRDGHPVLDVLDGREAPRSSLFAVYGDPGSSTFKTMVRAGDWKYIYMYNGGREQLFNLRKDPHELNNVRDESVLAQMRALLEQHCRRTNLAQMLDESGHMKACEFTERPLIRINQFDFSCGVTGFTFAD